MIILNFRDIDLMTETSPESARFAPNGSRYTALLFEDFNSMYLWSEEQDMPLTPGIRWLKNGSSFSKHSLAYTHGSSFKSLQWIYYLQGLFDQDGKNVIIQHKYYRGEKTIPMDDTNYSADGYAIIDGVKTIFEFNGMFIHDFINFQNLGCRWHGCTCIRKRTADVVKKAEQTNKRRIALEKEGYTVKVMRECDWDNLIQQEDVQKIPTRMANILKSDNEASLLESVKNGHIFGYLRCSVKSPESFIERLEKEW